MTKIGWILSCLSLPSIHKTYQQDTVELSTTATQFSNTWRLLLLTTSQKEDNPPFVLTPCENHKWVYAPKTAERGEAQHQLSWYEHIPSPSPLHNERELLKDTTKKFTSSSWAFDSCSPPSTAPSVSRDPQQVFSATLLEGIFEFYSVEVYFFS